MTTDWSLRVHYNKMAFDEVFGSIDEPGTYVRFKSNNIHSVMMHTGGGTKNPATPCRADYCCDVDNILKVFLDNNLQVKFFKHYILGEETLDRDQQNSIEQSVGGELRKRKLVPVGKYFRVMRRRYGN